MVHENMGYLGAVVYETDVKFFFARSMTERGPGTCGGGVQVGWLVNGCGLNYPLFEIHVHDFTLLPIPQRRSSYHLTLIKPHGLLSLINRALTSLFATSRVLG